MNVKEKIKKKFEKLHNAMVFKFKGLSTDVYKQQAITSDGSIGEISEAMDPSEMDVAECIQRIAQYHKSNVQSNKVCKELLNITSQMYKSNKVCKETNNWRKMHGLPMRRKEKR